MNHQINIPYGGSHEGSPIKGHAFADRFNLVVLHLDGTHIGFTFKSPERWTILTSHKKTDIGFEAITEFKRNEQVAFKVVRSYRFTLGIYDLESEELIILM